MSQVPIGESSTMPNSSAAGYSPEPVFSAPVSVQSLRPSVPRVSERAERPNFHNYTHHNFGAAAGSLVLCAAIVVAGSTSAASRRRRSAQTLRNLGPTEITGGDGPAGGEGSHVPVARFKKG